MSSYIDVSSREEAKKKRYLIKLAKKKKQSGTMYHITHTHTHTYRHKKVTELQMSLKYKKSFIVEKIELI